MSTDSKMLEKAKLLEVEVYKLVRNLFGIEGMGFELSAETARGLAEVKVARDYTS